MVPQYGAFVPRGRLARSGDILRIILQKRECCWHVGSIVGILENLLLCTENSPQHKSIWLTVSAVQSWRNTLFSTEESECCSHATVPATSVDQHSNHSPGNKHYLLFGNKAPGREASTECAIPASWQSNFSFRDSDCPSANICGAWEAKWIFHYWAIIILAYVCGMHMCEYVCTGECTVHAYWGQR